MTNKLNIVDGLIAPVGSELVTFVLHFFDQALWGWRETTKLEPLSLEVLFQMVKLRINTNGRSHVVGLQGCQIPGFLTIHAYEFRTVPLQIFLEEIKFRLTTTSVVRQWLTWHV